MKGVKISIICCIGILLLSNLTYQSPVSPGTAEDNSMEKSTPKPTPKPNPKPNPNKGGSSMGMSFLGMLIGPVLLVSAFPCLWYNERKAAIEARRIKLAKGECVDVDIYSEAEAMSKNGSLVFGKGQTLTGAYIRDPISGVGGNQLIKITRKVEVLQWRRKEKKENQQEVIYYELEWVAENSSTEGERYNNPANWLFENETIYNHQVYLGGFVLSEEVATLCQKTIPYHPNTDVLNYTREYCKLPDRNIQTAGKYIMMTPLQKTGYTPPGFDNMQTVNNFDSGEQPVGTMRLSFDLCPIGPLSVVGKAVLSPDGLMFQNYNIAEFQGTQGEGKQVPESFCGCLPTAAFSHFLAPFQEILVVQERAAVKEELFNELLAKSRQFTFFVRVLAYACMVLGICLFFWPITTLLGYIPLVGGFISGVAGLAIFIAAVITCIPLFLIGLSIAWIRFRPFVGLGLLGLGVTLLLVYWVMGGKEQE